MNIVQMVPLTLDQIAVEVEDIIIQAAGEIQTLVSETQAKDQEALGGECSLYTLGQIYIKAGTARTFVVLYSGQLQPADMAADIEHIITIQSGLICMQSCSS